MTSNNGLRKKVEIGGTFCLTSGELNRLISITNDPEKQEHYMAMKKVRRLEERRESKERKGVIL